MNHFIKLLDYVYNGYTLLDGIINLFNIQIYNYSLDAFNDINYIKQYHKNYHIIYILDDKNEYINIYHLSINHKNEYINIYRLSINHIIKLYKTISLKLSYYLYFR